MTVPPIIVPFPQFADANGKPYAGGTIETYEPGTTTPKQVWVDPEQSALQTDPIVLDAAGRCLMFGDGAYRLILRDSVGNEIWDQETTTIVSAAMAPVVGAATIADAQSLLGIDGSVSAEATARANADSAEQTARTNADTALGTRIDNEITRATNKENDLQSQIDTITGAPATGILPAGYSIRFGRVASDSSGNFSGTFSPPFPSSCDAITLSPYGSPSWFAIATGRSAGGFSGVTTSPLAGGDWHSGPMEVHYIAIGH